MDRLVTVHVIDMGRCVFDVSYSRNGLISKMLECIQIRPA
jgi:hypothetical protein